MLLDHNLTEESIENSTTRLALYLAIRTHGCFLTAAHNHCMFVPTGLHYIGQLHENSLLRIVMDQITEGQLQFVKLDAHFDTIVIGRGEESRKYTLHSGKTEMEKHLKEQFPDDAEAVEEYFKIMKVVHVADQDTCLFAGASGA